MAYIAELVQYGDVILLTSELAFTLYNLTTGCTLQPAPESNTRGRATEQSNDFLVINHIV